MSAGSGSASQGPDQYFPIVVTRMPITAAQRNAAIAIVLLLIAVAAIELPFAHIPLARVDAFIPVLQTVICVVDLTTAILLFAQFSVQPRRALLVLATGYIASGSFSFLQTLAFPGAYAPGGLFGDGVNSAAWFFVWWHTTFAAAILIYALTKDEDIVPQTAGPRTRVMIATAVAFAIVLVAGLTWLAIAGSAYLPNLYTGSVTQQTVFANNINVFLSMWVGTALVVLFLRRRTILDLWLIVTLCALMPNFLIAAVFTSVRFSFGWYSARMFVLVASCTLLVVLLTETTVLYARLANAVTLLRRERANRLMSLDAATAAMAHELRQPIATISASGVAAANWINKVPPNLDEVRSCIALMSRSARNAEEIIAAVRELFKDTARNRTEVRIGDIVQHDLSLLQLDLIASGIRVETELQADLPAVYADRTQLQQVSLNLIRNAIEAMGSTVPGARRLRLAARREGNSVVFSVQDSGPGIAAEDAARVFEPFFTTKPGGMGLGLAISRMIAQDHGGDLRLAQSGSDGCVFEIELQTAVAATVPDGIQVARSS